MNRQDAKDAKLLEPDSDLDHAASVVIDAALEVHRLLGPGLLESVYEQALSVEFGLRALKACAGLLPLRLAQVLSCLKASDHSLGLLINFNVPLLRQGIKRVVRTH